MGRNSIPDRWLNYKPVGKTIEGTRFIAFKVPLRQHISETVEDRDIRLDTKTLLQYIPNLGLIIDLTNTCKYYDPVVSFEEKDIKYVKIMVPGHAVPDLKYRNIFKKAVEEFLKINVNNDKLIGVHCTHGVNRTGFLICNYMVREMNIEPEEAIQRFSIARGHSIERENYKEFISVNAGELTECDNSSSEEDVKSKRPRREDVLTNDYYMYKTESSSQNYQNDFNSRHVQNSWINRQPLPPGQIDLSEQNYRNDCRSRPVQNSGREFQSLPPAQNKLLERNFKNDTSNRPDQNSWRERESQPPTPIIFSEQNYRNDCRSRPVQISWRECQSLPPAQNKLLERNFENDYNSRPNQNSWRERESQPPSQNKLVQNNSDDCRSGSVQQSWRQLVSSYPGQTELSKRNYDNTSFRNVRREHIPLPPGTETITTRDYNHDHNQRTEQHLSGYSHKRSQRGDFNRISREGFQEAERSSFNLSRLTTNGPIFEERINLKPEYLNMTHSNNRFTDRPDTNSLPPLKRDESLRTSSVNLNSRFAGNSTQSNNRNRYSKYDYRLDRTNDKKKSEFVNGSNDPTQRRSMLDDLY